MHYFIICHHFLVSVNWASDLTEIGSENHDKEC